MESQALFNYTIVGIIFIQTILLAKLFYWHRNKLMPLKDFFRYMGRTLVAIVVMFIIGACLTMLIETIRNPRIWDRF